MAEMTEKEVHRELDRAIIELEEIVNKSLEAPPLLAATIFHRTITVDAQRRLEALRAVRSVWAMRPLDSADRKVPPAQEELAAFPHGDVLDIAATMLLQATQDCYPDMSESVDDKGLDATVLGTCFDNKEAAEIDAGALVRGEHEIILCLDRYNLEREDKQTFVLNLANVVALARIGAQSLLDV